MIILTDILGSWSKPLVWTLLHSLWQGLLIITILVLMLRLIPSTKSSIRYLASTAALCLILVSSVVTCLYLSHPENSLQDSMLMSFDSNGNAAASHSASLVQDGILNIVSNFIEANLYWITIAWMCGAFLFSIRIATGFLYISSVKKSAIYFDDVWNSKLQDLAAQLGLKHIVHLAESSQITVPFVIGYFKPLILIPTGMISGLTTEQLESILVHELMHIKRNDYVINIIQTFIEALFFFNPFVWIISTLIRREREHCCDDEVVKHGSALAYAHALTQLEELNLSNRSLVLSLAENKNQLLKRIKRIMEKSVQNYSLKERIVPIVLLIVGLTCASWLTIKSPVNDSTPESKKIVALDTPGTEKPVRHTRKITVVHDEDGNPKEEIVEVYEGEEGENLGDWDALAHWEFDFPEMPPVPEIDFPDQYVVEIPAIAPFPPMAEMPELAEMPSMPAIAAMPDFPAMAFMFGDTTPDWRTFSKEFQARFKEKFGDFYNKHGEELEKMMREVNKELQRKMDSEWERAAQGAQINEEIAVQQMKAQEDAMRHQRHAMADVERQMEKVRADQANQQRQIERKMMAMQDQMRSFEKALEKQLRKDGYLGDDDKLDTINWNDDDVLTINGKKIKDSDKSKYEEFRKTFFEEVRKVGRPE